MAARANARASSSSRCGGKLTYSLAVLPPQIHRRYRWKGEGQVFRSHLLPRMRRPAVLPVGRSGGGYAKDDEGFMA
ncbi:MAG: hypothetical protein JWO04_3217 [Gammaproteobacteria bacterium]|nr:hypothetical protein [Gammaproteobacteria bacterium]